MINFIKLSSRFFRLALLIFLIFSLLLQAATGHGMNLDLIDILKIFTLLITVALVHFYPGIKDVRIKRHLRFVLIGLLVLVIAFLFRLLKELASIEYEDIIVGFILLGLVSLLILADIILIYGLLKFRIVK